MCIASFEGIYANDAPYKVSIQMHMYYKSRGPYVSFHTAGAGLSRPLQPEEQRYWTSPMTRKPEASDFPGCVLRADLSPIDDAHAPAKYEAYWRFVQEEEKPIGANHTVSLDCKIYDGVPYYEPLRQEDSD